MMKHYILSGRTPVPCGDFMSWAIWFEAADRKVARDTVGECDISTVFLGLDHQFGKGPPLLFETMVFGGALDGECVRASTWDEALSNHREMMASAARAEP